MPKISEAVKHDHALIKNVYHRLAAASPEDRKSDEFIWKLDRYLIVDDLLVTPALERYVVHGGKERHRRLSDDYDSASLHKLRRMQTFDPAEDSFESSLKAIWVDLEPHIREESTRDLEHLEENMSESESEALAKKYEGIKQLLQQPYGEDGAPDARTLSAILEMPRQELRVKIGLSQ
ncbi:hypothetical protein B0T17DRAFT_491002 [Bombardia bombarda]|uniref:Hemerythrin-like domain-containing protein n=1 Tax=Bombardia bombarda TaxID=252184 RepID=A0AA39XAT4_9PEZI|nr:hypothetical protein B0T17DRAFT_491002 [Bombardia bombarda]